MKIQMVLVIDKDDNVRLRDIAEAFNLVGGGASEKAAVRKKRTHELTELELESKLFGKIDSGQFTMEDARKAVGIILTRAQALIERTKSEPVFEDPARQKVWEEGIISNAGLAVRKAQQFFTDLSEDMLAVRV